MDDAIEKVAPPRDIEAGVRASDTASIAIERDTEMEPFVPMNADSPGFVGESRVGYELVGGS